MELPLAIQLLTQSILDGQEYSISLPEAFVKLEKEFLTPKKTPNAMKYFKGKKKDSLISRDNVEIDTNSCSSMQFMWSHCGFGEVIETKVRKVDSDTNNCDSNEVKCAQDIVWPYLCALNMTIADLLVLSCFVELMSSVT